MARDEECGDRNLQVNFPTGKDGDGDNVAWGGLTLVDWPSQPGSLFVIYFLTLATTRADMKHQRY